MFGSSAFAATEQKIAVVDINKVVSASSQVKILSKAQQAKAKAMAKFVKEAEKDIAKQTTEEAKKQLTAKYEKQFIEKKQANAKEYSLKLKEIDKNITAQIAQQAKSMGYTMVIAKSAVVVSGDDITDAIVKVVK